MWSSAMVIAPLLRGLFGLEWNALNHRLRVAPHLPADWDRARLRNVPVGSAKIDVEYVRSGTQLTVRATGGDAEGVCLTSQLTPQGSCAQTLTLTLDPIELAIPATLPEEGSATSQLKVLNEQFQEKQAIVTFAAPAGSTFDLPVRLNRPHVTVTGGEIRGTKLHIEFGAPAARGKTVVFTW
jgi:hypothetical protein